LAVSSRRAPLVFKAIPPRRRRYVERRSLASPRQGVPNIGRSTNQKVLDPAAVPHGARAPDPPREQRTRTRTKIARVLPRSLRSFCRRFPTRTNKSRPVLGPAGCAVAPPHRNATDRSHPGRPCRTDVSPPVPPLAAPRRTPCPRLLFRETRNVNFNIITANSLLPPRPISPSSRTRMNRPPIAAVDEPAPVRPSTFFFPPHPSPPLPPHRLAHEYERMHALPFLFLLPRTCSLKPPFPHILVALVRPAWAGSSLREEIFEDKSLAGDRVYVKYGPAT